VALYAASFAMLNGNPCGVGVVPSLCGYAAAMMRASGKRSTISAAGRGRPKK
jgi:hypothetical protein